MRVSMFSRRSRLTLTLVALIVAPTVAANRPNVLFIAIDDLRPELGCYGSSVMHTPNLDRLAQQGTLFRRAYTQQALCAPARASLLTGLRPDSTGIFGLSTPVREKLPDVRTLPQHFREHGYETISLGKIYHHASDDNGIGWSRPAWMPEGPWFRWADPASAPDAPNGRPRSWECVDVPDNTYRDGQIAERALEELERLGASPQPFFLAVGFFHPHLPFFAPKRYWDLYDRASIRLPEPQDWPVDMPHLATSDWGELRQYKDIPKQGRLTDEDARTLVHGYYASVSYADALVGQVLARLDELGLRGNTIVVVWGDHGYKLAEYGAWCKHTNLEIDARVPLIVARPEQRTAGVPVESFVESVDLYPTLAELCGLSLPAHLEGTSFAPLLADPKRTWKQLAFTQYPQGHDNMGYSIRDDRWRYTEWIDQRDGRVVARELYDHSNGAIATVNLAENPAFTAEVRRLSRLLDRGQGWRRWQPSAGAHHPSDS
jgi:iduronate 2-sulfatase